MPNTGFGLRSWLLAAVIAALALASPSCRPSADEAAAEREARQRQWAAEMKEVFPEQTNDTTEMRRRLEYYQQSGNKFGEQNMYRLLGTSARDVSMHRQAIELHQAGLEVAYSIADTMNITYLLNELGTDYRRIGAVNEAAPYYYRSLQVAEGYNGRNLESVRRNIASAYNGLGSIYRTMNEPDEALAVYEKALAITLEDENHRSSGINYANIGAVWFDRGDYAKAEEYYRLSLDYNVKADYPVGIALSRVSMGRVYENTGRIEEALAELLKADELMKSSRDKWRQIEVIYKTGDIYTQMGRFDKAYGYLEQGLRIAFELGSLTYIQRGYRLLSEYNFARGDYKLAAEQMLVTQAYADTVQQNLEKDRLLESRVKYETDRFTRQIENLDEAARIQAARRKNTLMMTIPAIIVLVALVLMLLWRRRLEGRQAAEISNLNRMRSNFFTNIAHEFRTPLTTILGYSGRLHEKLAGGALPDSEDVDGLARINRGGNTLLNLVNELLEFARSEAGMSRLVWRQGDLAGFLRSVAEPFGMQAREKSVSLSVVSVTSDLVMNYAPEAIKKVIGNLLSNALRHTPAGGRIEMLLRPDEGAQRCVITVRDNGEGIAPDALPRIFELYYTSGAGGMGIGLALSKQLVEEMGGTIAVQSTPGRGTEFTITLPVSRAEIPAERLAEVPATLTEGENIVAGSSATHKTTNKAVAESSATPAEGKMPLAETPDDDNPVILVVEDDPDMASYVRTVLGGGYTVLHAANGVEGLAMAEQYVPDLILTDVMMPEKDGYELTADLRASVATSHIPVVMLTAKTTSDDKVAGLQVGADAYLPKPFNERELTAHIEQLLTSRAKLREIYADALQAGGFDDIEAVDIDDRDRDFIARLLVAVNSHLDDEAWFPDGLAEEMCLSRSQLYRKVKTMTGKTLLAFIMDVRMKRAGAMLSNGNRNITEVALACGFSDMSYFTRSFKTAFGCTPSQYVKNTEP